MRGLSFAIMIMNFLLVRGSRSCLWSKETAMKVNSCPESEDETERRTKLKNCDSLATKQNCTEPSKFKYHCLINEFESAFIEVCAESYLITSGKCAEYNTVGALVQRHERLKCNETEPSCPSPYISTDAFRYKVCYEMVRKKIDTSRSKQRVMEINPSENSLDPALTVVIVVVVIVVIIIVTALFVIKVCIPKYTKGSCTLGDCVERSQTEEEMILCEQSGIKNKWKEKECDPEKYKDEISRAEELSLLAMRSGKYTDMVTKLETYQDQTEAFLAAYRHVREKFVETNLSRECINLLKTTRIAILTGQQGCGKTLTAVYIMESDDYKEWKKNIFGRIKNKVHGYDNVVSNTTLYRIL